jgi:lipopolysaccharide biosynthesis protein
VTGGAAGGRDPNPLFDTSFYVEQNADVAAAGVNPLAHYLTVGAAEGRDPMARPPAPSTRRFTVPSAPYPFQEAYGSYVRHASSRTTADYVALDESGVPPHESGVRVIAFYLPQFHPMPVNDAAWGRGFTEWTNVAKAVPQFLGHYQPRLPGELGFYDLRVPDIQQRQVELARLYGLHGFCFHFYWFGGQRVLDLPLSQFHGNKGLDLPYCLCWANENWTRRWDGQDDEVLLAQAHSPEDDLAFLDAISPFLADPRYIRVDGKPLLIVYRAQLLPDPAATARRWRECRRKHGLPEPFLVAARTFGLIDPTPLGFDAAVEFPPHNIAVNEITAEVSLLNREFRGRVYPYPELVDRMIASYRGEAFPVFRAVAPGWDNEARRPGAGHAFFASDPALYGQWLTSACAVAAQQPRPDLRMVFVNAWNEWAEGAYLEPDRRYGYAYLAETKRVVSPFAAGRDHARLGVIVHLYYDDLWPGIRRCLHNIPEPFDLYVTIPPSLRDETRRQLRLDFPRLEILECENRGRDVLPFLKVLGRIGPSRYQYLCKIHSKKTLHRADGAEWRDQALEGLLGSPGVIDRTLAMFDAHPDLAMVGPTGMILQSTYYWGLREEARSNREYVRALAHRTNIASPTDHFYFVAGSMFWLRPHAVSELLELKLADDEFEAETEQRDGTLAHALERFHGLLALTKGFWLADTAGARFDRVVDTGRPLNAASLGRSFAHPTFDGEPID